MNLAGEQWKRIGEGGGEKFAIKTAILAKSPQLVAPPYPFSTMSFDGMKSPCSLLLDEKITFNWHHVK